MSYISLCLRPEPGAAVGSKGTVRIVIGCVASVRMPRVAYFSNSIINDFFWLLC